MNDPAARNVSFEELAAAYREVAEGLAAGGADILLVETVFDTLNAKAAIFGIDEAFDALGYRLPLVVSGTIVDASGRTLTGQTVEAFWAAIRHADPLLVGLNCALGAKQLREHVEELGRIADVPLAAYPNAGLPNELGGYDETPEVTSTLLGEWARAGLVNLAGSCCGSTPEHTAAIAAAVAGVAAARDPGPASPSRASRVSSRSRSRCPATRSSTSASGPTSPARASSPGSWQRAARARTRPSRSPATRSRTAP